MQQVLRELAREALLLVLGPPMLRTLTNAVEPTAPLIPPTERGTRAERT